VKPNNQSFVLQSEDQEIVIFTQVIVLGEIREERSLFIFKNIQYNFIIHPSDFTRAIAISQKFIYQIRLTEY
jgi:hypothetical protein